MKFVSWNVNGLRSVLKKGFEETFKALDADFFCLQEIRLQEGQADFEPEGYRPHYNYAERKGYSGTAIYARGCQADAVCGIGREEHDREGRVLTLDLGPAYLVCVYTPNSQNELARLPYRLEWEEAFADYLRGLDAEKPVIVCGDLNVAHRDIDLSNPARNHRSAGFTDEERGALQALLDSGFTDTFRHLHPDVTGVYSWWSQRFRCREKNIGWRIDYFLISDRLVPLLRSAEIHTEILGSDHCPVSIDLAL